MKRIGIYSGTFDPVHKGHISFAGAALQQAKLDEIWWLVEPKPRNKEQVTPIRHRRAMVYLAIANDATMKVVDAPEETFTLDGTFMPLQKLAGKNAKLFLLAGEDVVNKLHTWPGLKEIARYQPGFIAGIRGGKHAEQAVSRRIETALGTEIEFFEVETTDAHVTSSIIRGSHDIRSLQLPPAVHAYTRQNRLYL